MTTQTATAVPDQQNEQPSSQHVQPPPASSVIAEEPENQDEQYGWIIHEWVNVRGGPTTKSEIVTRLYRGSKVKLLKKVETKGSGESWWLVELEDQTVAYIYVELVSLERYVNPWTRFRMGCRRTDASLGIISAVEKPDDDKTPTAVLLLNNSWIDLSKGELTTLARTAFKYWRQCLVDSGFRTKKARIVLRNLQHTDLIEVTPETSSQALVKFLD